jgi:aspartate/methionine/tyrosine aminotransferase
MRGFAQRMEALGTESAFEVLAQAKALEKQGKRIIHFEIGEPDFDTPEPIRDAAKKALDEGWTHYVPAGGIDPIKEAIQDYIERDRGFRPSADQIVVVPGAKPIIFNTIMGLVDPGDGVILQDPGFPIYESLVNFIGGERQPVELKEENEFRMTPDEINELVTDRTKLIILNSPENPTGSVCTKEDIEGIADIVEDNNLYILSDEVYSQILYDMEHFSPSTRDVCQERTILLDGFSKTYAMTGWRLGYGVMPPELATRYTQLNINTVSCTSAFSQVAGATALNMDQTCVGEMVAKFRGRRDEIVRLLNEVPGFTCLKPEGAFYVYPNISGTGMNASQLKDVLMNEVGISALPGTAFGHVGTHHMRFSYATSLENIREGMGMIKEHFS